MEDRLRDLKAFHDDGLMTDDEYVEKIQLVVDQLDGTQLPRPTPPPVKLESTAAPLPTFCSPFRDAIGIAVSSSTWLPHLSVRRSSSVAGRPSASSPDS
jgi:hypothetical protein